MFAKLSQVFANFSQRSALETVQKDPSRQAPPLSLSVFVFVLIFGFSNFDFRNILPIRIFAWREVSSRPKRLAKVTPPFSSRSRQATMRIAEAQSYFQVVAASTAKWYYYKSFYDQNGKSSQKDS